MQSANDRFLTIKKIGFKRKVSEDIYHKLLTITWSKFFIIYLVFFLVFNLLFGVLYWIFPNTLLGTNGGFFHAVAFSVQTFSTVGYGAFSPSSNYAHGLVIIESFLSVFVTALLTGLVFAKFSKPQAKILFSSNVLINQFDGKKTLMFRISNLRSNHIAEAKIRVVILKNFKTPEGQSIRKQIDLELVRDSSLFFALTWTVMHVIDERSPLFGYDLEKFKNENIEVAVSVIGHDSTMAQTIHSNALYTPDEIVFDKYFKDVVYSEGNKVVAVDLTNFHSYE